MSELGIMLTVVGLSFGLIYVLAKIVIHSVGNDDEQD